MERIVKYSIVSLFVLFILIAIQSLTWPVQHDLPIILYIVFLIDNFHAIPYAQIFDMNMPGTYYIYWVIVKIAGYSHFWLRVVDIIILLSMMGINYNFMKRIGKQTAIVGSLLWGICYLSYGEGISLQREYLMLLFILSGAAIYLQMNKRFLKAFIAGILFGVAASMKPHSAIGLVVLLLYEYLQLKDAKTGNTFFKMIKLSILPLVAGFILPLLIVGIILWKQGGTLAFYEIVKNYWPLYTHLNGAHEVLSIKSLLAYTIEKFRSFGGNTIWITAAFFGFYHSVFQTKTKLKNQIYYIAGFVIVYAIYPLFAGQFWPYHYLLLLFFVIQLSSLILLPSEHSTSMASQYFRIAFLGIVFMLSIHIHFVSLMLNITSPKEIRVSEITAFLKENLKPGDTVQPNDWAGGGVINAMLGAKAKIATPFIYDFYFYHDTSSCYIKSLRKEYIEGLNKTRPRYIIVADINVKEVVVGSNTTTEFPELENIISTKYYKVKEGTGYKIYEKTTNSFSDKEKQVITM